MAGNRAFQIPTTARVLALVLVLATSVIRLLIALALHRGTWVTSGELLLVLVCGSAYMSNQRWGKQWLIGITLFNMIYFALRGLIHAEVVLAVYEAIAALLVLGVLSGRPSRVRAAGCLFGYVLVVLGSVGALTILSSRRQPLEDVVGRSRAAARFQSEYLYEVVFDALPWRMMTAEQAGEVLGARVEDADLRLIREDGSSFALFFPLQFNNVQFSPELGVQLEEEIEDNWLRDLHSWQRFPYKEGFLLTAEGQVDHTPLAYAIFYKHFGNFGLYAVFWSEAQHRGQLVAEAQAFYDQVSAPPLKERLPRLNAAEVYSLNSNAVVLINVYDASGVLVGRGSGFNLAPQGLVVTNFHVLAHGQVAEVVFPRDGTYREVAIAGVSGADADLAILALRGEALPTVRAVRTVDVVPGDVVYVIGNPKGLVNSVSEGIIGGIRRDRELVMYQITAAISDGSSGGPVFNEYGEVIGIASSLIEKAQNLNFSIAIDELQRLFILPQPLTLEQFHSLLEEKAPSD